MTTEPESLDAVAARHLARVRAADERDVVRALQAAWPNRWEDWTSAAKVVLAELQRAGWTPPRR